MRDDDDLRRLERQRSRLGAKPVALRPLPYGHPLGPTGTAPKTFGHCGGGLRNNVWATNVTKWEKDVIAETAKQFGHHGWSLVGRRPLVPWDTNWRLVRDSNAQRKQRSRITANGGKRRPVGRPRVDNEVERRIHRLLADGRSVKSIASNLGISRSVVQRVQGGG